ncbi:hypothetical protein CkaCkLH20_04418 [Colletotrichum karsti]|uniref:Uncharacterized protein n=1 Tax=Colletotrichum karsti TaxID=1095194 RepID=A0A9P6I6L1_9PEZI|nr:uncharacterized protein CkaCkLH20_04418 [Colletotrichum karsti]KAF9877842.1 hypothetical protein CkaCkLH20_04418 [Colletotrichum karsti]
MPRSDDPNEPAWPSSFLPSDDYARVRKSPGAPKKGNFFSRLFRGGDTEYSRIKQSRTEQQQPKRDNFFSKLIDRAAASFKKQKKSTASFSSPQKF